MLLLRKDGNRRNRVQNSMVEESKAAVYIKE
jgi:hypothetical protein